jgi:hypothetical protein
MPRPRREYSEGYCYHVTTEALAQLEQERQRYQAEDGATARGGELIHAECEVRSRDR